MNKRYIVKLSKSERNRLSDLVNKGKEAAYRRRHAQLLLLVDEGEYGPACHDLEAAEQVEASRPTVERLRQRCVEEGLDVALERRKRQRERSRVLDGESEAQLVALACSAPPAGMARWTLQLLCEELQKKQVVLSVSYETVRQVLKKHHQTLATNDVVHTA